MKFILKALAMILFTFNVPSISDAFENPATTQVGESDLYRVVFHIDTYDASISTKALNTIRNLINDPRMGEKGKKLEISLLVNANGYPLLQRDSEDREKIVSLQDMGVKFKICNNTLKARNLSKNDLMAAVEIVPSGIGELVILQNLGWAYIRLSN